MKNNGGRRKVGTGGISKKPKDVRATLKANRKNQEQRYASEAGPMATEEPAHTPLDQIPDLLKRYTDSYVQALRLLEPVVDNNGDLARHARDVPLAYRAQIEDRCQPQRIVPDPQDGIQDSVRFVRQWTSNTPYGNQARPYHLSNPFHHTGQFSDPSLTLCETVQIDWRLLSNSGQLADMICPVIGAGGWPFIPGSSIKGLFRRSCSPQQQLKWCGQESRQAISPGLLRFHGAWPQDISWTKGLLDLTHPQENWQVGIEDVNRHNANALISLLKPNLTIAISSTKPLEQSEWQEIKDILRNALRNGIGGRTAAGYGIPAEKEGESASDVSALLWTWKLRGQGPASKLLDGSPEFRPLMFRAAIRSMALRLFAGIVGSSRAQMEVKRLFGGFNPGAEPFVGLLATRFRNTQTPWIERFGVGPNSQNVYVCEGELSWHLINNREVDRDSLSKLLASLHALVLTLGGFGRSWRRPDHRLFMPSYRTRPIGCYWEWGEPPKNFTMPKTSAGIAGLLENAQSLAFTWLKSQYPDEFQSRTSCSRTDLPGWEQNRVSSKEKKQGHTVWREVIHPKRMIVWSRVIDTAESAIALKWTHSPIKGEQRNPALNLSRHELKGLKGGIGLVSRLWITVTPIQQGFFIEEQPNVGQETECHDNDMRLEHHSAGRFLEVVTCFPDSNRLSVAQSDFIECLNAGGDANPPFVFTWGENEPQ